VISSLCSSGVPIPKIQQNWTRWDSAKDGTLGTCPKSGHRLTDTCKAIQSQQVQPQY